MSRYNFKATEKKWQKTWEDKRCFHAEPDPKKERYIKRETPHGEIPSPVNIGTGCRFVNRCPKAMKECYGQTPTLESVNSLGATQHAVACHLYS